MFWSEICKMFKSIYFEEHLSATASFKLIRKTYIYFNMRTKTVKNKGCNDFHFECKIQCYISYDITFVKIKGFLSHGTE